MSYVSEWTFSIVIMLLGVFLFPFSPLAEDKEIHSYLKRVRFGIRPIVSLEFIVCSILIFLALFLIVLFEPMFHRDYILISGGKQFVFEILIPVIICISILIMSAYINKRKEVE